MLLIRRFRIAAVFCSLAVLVCELISRPFAEMGISDDGLYVLIARTLAATGHVVYNGNTTPFLGWQLYLGAAFIRMFGFSFTAVRMSTLLVSVMLAFVVQRILVRCGIQERNATFGTLAFVLSPLYLVLSVTYMSDIFGLFGIALCLYGCIRSLQASTDRSTILWLCFAVAANAIFGSARQIAWLGVLVLVPSTLWLLRSRRRVLFAGSTVTLAGMLFVLACMVWFLHQPYNVHESLIPSSYPYARASTEIAHTLAEFVHTFLDIPFLLLPVFVLFLPSVRRGKPRALAVVVAIFLAYVFLAIHLRHSHPDFLLEPTGGARGGWVGIHGIHEGTDLLGDAPILLQTWFQVLLTIVCVGGLLGLFVSFTLPAKATQAMTPASSLSWKQLGTLLGPYALVYALLLIPRATDLLFDRYVLCLLFVLLIVLVRYYQERIQARVSLAGFVVVALMAVFGVVLTHNTFAFYRARVALANEVHAAGIPFTSTDNGWEYNFNVELDHADHINDARITIPAHAYRSTPAPPLNQCRAFWYAYTPHVHPLYGVSFDPHACYGPAGFAPAQYSRWFAGNPGTLYVVRYAPTSERP